MTALLKELAVAAVALLGSAGAVTLLGDRSVLVPPPEMVVEEFVRDLSLGRWGPARTHLTERLAHRIHPDSLHALLQQLEHRAGRVEQVRGRPLCATDVAAEAAAEITGSAGSRAMWWLPLSREHGLWKISRLDIGS